ncbi:MAG: HlyD family secretion protein [Chitinophagales bacterium]
MAETKTSNKKKILPIILFFIVAGGIAYGVSKYIYSLHHVTTDDAQVDGDINPVNARISGYINKIFFKENQQVRQGDTLVTIDDRDLRIRIQQARAALDNAVANVAVTKANISAAFANTGTAQSNIEQQKVRVWKATQDFTRYESLLADKSITKAQFDAAKADKESAESAMLTAQKQLVATRAQTNASGEQVAVSESLVNQRQADLDFAILQASYTIITSPVNGIAAKKNIQEGQLVQAGQMLFAIVTDTNSYIVANFKETQLEKMKEGQKVEVQIDAFPDEKITGRVYSFSGATGARFSLLPPDNATGNFVKVVQRLPVKIAMSIPHDRATKLRPGMSAKVTVFVD